MKLIKGDIIYSSDKRELLEFRNSYLGFDGEKIKGIFSEVPEGEHEIIDRTGSIVIPGLVDLHLHAPQYTFAGLYMDEELLSWLERHTFPMEARYSDLEFADKAYEIFAEDLKMSETTRISSFATIHKDATILLMKKLSEKGMRGFVGKVNMDRNCPDYLREDTAQSLSDTESFIREVEDIDGIKPIITPRFTPSCTDELERGLGELSRKYNIPVQSHLDENLNEIEWVKQLCPWSSSYSDAYDRFGLFGDTPTIMAHVVWPREDEIELMKRKGVYIAHSPSSNGNLSSGIAPVRRYLDEGMNVGLATDVAGGSTLSLFRIMTEAIEQSKIRWRLMDSSLKPITFADGFYMATRGGGSFFGKVGAFEEGYDADILVIDGSRIRTALIEELSPSEKLELYSSRYPGEFLTDKYIAGKKIF